MKRKYDSCVFKRDWKHYKTCFECKCQCTEYRPDLIGRIYEVIVLGWYRIKERIIIRRYRKTMERILKKRKQSK